MKKYYCTIITILFFGLLSCSTEETRTKRELASRPSAPILDRTVSDIDGNVYRIATIGAQTWTKTNLNVTRYRNGDPIPQVQNAAAWVNITTGAWCYYNNNPANGATYGKLYNLYAVKDPRGLAPEGYHIPSDAEWTTLISHLGGESVAGGAMKAITLWNSPNTGATNSSGFTGLPGGCRASDGTFYNIGNSGLWWSSSMYFTSNAWGRYLLYNYGAAYRGYGNIVTGSSVRCLRD